MAAIKSINGIRPEFSAETPAKAGIILLAARASLNPLDVNWNRHLFCLWQTKKSFKK